MRKAFASLDDVLIEALFQPTSNVVRQRFGVSRGFAACFCVDLASLAWIVSRTPELACVVGAWDACRAFLDVSILLLGLVALVVLRRLFRRMADRRGNPLRVAMRPYRAIVLLMLLAHVVQRAPPEHADPAGIAMLAFAAAALYLGACSEPPRIRHPGAAPALAN